MALNRSPRRTEWLPTVVVPAVVGSSGSGDRNRGASLVEYALLIGLIALVAFAAVGFLGGNVGDGLSSAGSSLN